MHRTPSPSTEAEDLFEFTSVRRLGRKMHISLVDIDVGSGEFDVVAEASTPVLSPGLPVFLMKAGVSLSCIKEINGRVLMYCWGGHLEKLCHGTIIVLGLQNYPQVRMLLLSYSTHQSVGGPSPDPISLSYPFLLY